MGYKLDAPRGMSARAVIGADGEPRVEFFVAPHGARCGASEVKRLVTALEEWLRKYDGEVSSPAHEDGQ